MEPRVILIGDVFLDVFLTPSGKENKIRLGGIIHPARALWALGIPYDLAYIAPEYLTNHVEKFAKNQSATTVSRIGLVRDAPNIAIVSEPTEAGSQGYELPLRENYRCEFNEEILNNVFSSLEATDVVISAGSYELGPLLLACSKTKANIHIDLSYYRNDITLINCLGKKFDTGIISTSSSLFINRYDSLIDHLCTELMQNYCQSILFKENRGGARYFTSGKDPIYVEAQVRPIVHSVGVGDCFNVVFAALQNKYQLDIALTYASWISAEYASTFCDEDFKKCCDKVFLIKPEQIVGLKGVSLPWERRKNCHIYIAAPDFDYVDKSIINKVVDCLQYHNFVPHLPIRENGQITENATPQEKLQLFGRDIQLLNGCQIVLAILINNDPGTLIEIGLAGGMGIPVVVYDPYKMATNLMLTQSPYLVSSSLDAVIGKIFELASRSVL